MHQKYLSRLAVVSVVGCLELDSSGWMSQRVDVSVGGNLDGWMSRWVDVSVGRYPVGEYQVGEYPVGRGPRIFFLSHVLPRYSGQREQVTGVTNMSRILWSPLSTASSTSSHFILCTLLRCCFSESTTVNWLLQPTAGQILFSESLFPTISHT